jgi:hypothetical protein
MRPAARLGRAGRWAAGRWGWEVSKRSTRLHKRSTQARLRRANQIEYRGVMRIFPQVFTAALRDVLESVRPARFAISVSCIVVPLGCGGGQAVGGGGQSPDPPGASTSASAASAILSRSVASEPTTTMASLADAGETQGTKLTETGAVGSTSASATSFAKTPHGHDPGRGPDDIGAIVKAHRDEARACYEKALTDHPGIEGDLVLSWTVDPKGNVSQIGLDASRSQITEPTLVTCISEIIKRILFAPSPAGFETKASYPFNLHPRHGRPAP